MKKVASLLVLALAALALVACGGDDDGDTSATTAETTAESTTGGGAEGAAQGSVVQIEAAGGSELAYVQKEVKAEAGPVSIEFTNPQSLSHDVKVEDQSGGEVGATELIADSKTTATIADLKPGDYTFYCSVPGHREGGMEGTLTVE
jgi:uncharacterized cupredoxin-like copper-binding protein